MTSSLIGCYNVIQHRTGVLLIRERRGDLRGLYGLPAGKLEIGEDILQCATREAKEETGLNVTPVYLVGIYQVPSLRGHNVVNFAFASITGDDSSKLTVGAEYVDLHAVRSLAASGGLRDQLILRIVEDYFRGGANSLRLLHVLHTEEVFNP